MIGQAPLKKDRLIYLICIFIFCFTCLAYGGDDPLTPDERQWLKAHDDRIRINHESDWAPILFADKNGNPSGIAADYYRLVEKKLGFKFKIDSPHTWETVIERFHNNEIDVICNIAKTGERTRTALFTDPYFTIKSVIIVRKKIRKNLHLTDMGGMKITAASKSMIFDYLNSQYGFLNIIPSKNAQACMLAVSAGTMDAAVVNIAFASHAIETMGISNLRIAGYTDPDYHICFASKKEMPVLNAVLTKGLGLITKEEKQQIHDRWIHLDIEPFYKKQNFWVIILGMAGACLGIIVVFLVVNRKLHREVDVRTLSLAEKNQRLEKEVTARKKIQKDLEKRETHLRTLVNSIADLVWIKDPESRYVACNSKFEAFFNIKEKELIGRSDFDLVSQDQARSAVEDDKTAMSSGAPVTIEERVKSHGHKHHAYIETIKTPMYDALGKTIGVLSIGRDITQRKQAEKELRQYRNLLASILANIKGLTYRCRVDADLTVLFISNHITEMTGYSPETFMNKPVKVFDQLIFKEDREKVGKAMHRAATSKVPWEMEYRLHHRDGSVVWVVEKVAAVEDQQGQIKYLDGFLVDITRQKLMEEHLSQTHKMEALGTLAGGISHDFNNILGGILGFSELLQEDMLAIKCPEKMQRKINNIMKAGMRAKELVAQILGFSRIDKSPMESVSMATVIEETMILLKASLPHNIDLVTTEFSRQRVMGESAKLHQVIMNLCTNAAYAMKNTGGTLSVSLTDIHLDLSGIDCPQDVSPGPFLHLCVKDQGEGMDLKTRQKIMQPFFTTKPKGDGTGMGLWLVSNVVKSMEGFIQVESVLGEGSQFHVYLPAVEPPASAAAISGDAGQNGLSGREKILFVDDEKSLTQLAWEFLSDLGYQVTVCNRGADALGHIQTVDVKFDLVITDLNMPEMTGNELSRKIRAITPEMPIILTTGDAQELNPAIEFDEVLEKPILIHEMARTIRKIMDAKKRRG